MLSRLADAATQGRKLCKLQLPSSSQWEKSLLREDGAVAECAEMLRDKVEEWKLSISDKRRAQMAAAREARKIEPKKISKGFAGSGLTAPSAPTIADPSIFDMHDDNVNELGHSDSEWGSQPLRRKLARRDAERNSEEEEPTPFKVPNFRLRARRVAPLSQRTIGSSTQSQSQEASSQGTESQDTSGQSMNSEAGEDTAVPTVVAARDCNLRGGCCGVSRCSSRASR